MKIPASKVPAQVWADKMRTEGDLSEAESERLRRWDSSKQVYRVNSTLWDELKIDNKDEIPVSVFSKLPYDCIFIERKDSFTVPLPLGDLISDVLDADGNMIISTNGHFCWCENEKLYISPLINSVYLKIEDVTKRNVLYERTCFNCSIDLKNSVTFDEVMKDLKSYISVSMNDENLDKGSARMKRIINEMHTEGRKTVFDNPLAKSFFKLIPKKMLSEALKSYARSTWLDIAMDYKALFGGFDHLRVITFSYGLGFVETVADMFEDVEIIIGSMNTVRPDIVDVAMHQKLEMKRLSKRKQLVERVKDGSVRIYFNMRKMSHEKLYILSADDGRCRIITGSANLSKRAFTGGQYEEITCFDGDVVMFDNRLARFESLKGMSSTTPLEPAAMVDFASVAGDSEGELEVVPVMRAKGVVYLCDMPEDDDEVETFYTFNPKDMTEEEREQYAAMREHKVDYKPVTGGRVIIPDEVRRVIRAAREAKAEREVRAVAYPKFHYDTESGAATLNGEAYEVQPEGAWVDDAHRISDIMRGYDSFIGDVEVTKQQFFKVLAFMFTAPFMTRVRKVAMRHGYSFTLFPLYCILYGDSNAGKTTFMELCLQAMYGSPQTGKVSHEEWTPTGIKAINSLCPEMGLLIDDMPWKRFQTNADAIIKRDGAWLNREDVLSPIYTLTVNKMGGLKPELAKRSVPIRTEVRIDREVGTVGKKTLSDSIGRLTTAFFLEYLARMEPLVEEMEDMIRVGSRDYLPDLLNLSSVTLREMFEEAGESDTWNAPLTFRDFIGETATARVAREKLLEAWRVDPSQFKVRPNNQGVEYKPDGSDADRTLKFEVKAIYDELPAYLNAAMVNSVIVFKDTASLESFLGVRLDKSLGAMVRRAVRTMRGGKAD